MAKKITNKELEGIILQGLNKHPEPSINVDTPEEGNIVIPSPYPSKKSMDILKRELSKKVRGSNEDLLNTIYEIILERHTIYPKEKEGSYDMEAINKGYHKIGSFYEYLLREENKELKKQLREEQKKKKGKFKRAGHYIDQVLKYNYPKDKQPSLFDTLQTNTIKDIEVAGVEITQVVEGIKLSPSETKVIDCLCKLLHENSQTLDEKKEDYYSGNSNYDLVEHGGDKNTPAPKLAFTLYELTKEYKGGETTSGKDVENVKQILKELDNKRFLLSYVETTKKKDGGRIEKKIEDFKKLIHIIKVAEYDKDNKPVDIGYNDTEVVLNPIFRRQIDSKFILYPNDINKRTIIAYGSHNVSEITLRLRDYIMRLHSSPRMSREINLERLYYLLAEKWMKESRKKKVKEYTDKAIETLIAMGLLTGYEIKTNATGEPKIVFHINKEWD